LFINWGGKRVLNFSALIIFELIPGIA
jgi:hypothetical protein